MYIKLPTYKKVVIDHRSKSLKLWSHLPIVVCTSQAESLPLLQEAPPDCRKLMPVFSHLNLSHYEIPDMETT
jgi:hypothetical protein